MMPEFRPNISKVAIAPVTVAPAGLQCTAELFLGPDENTKAASSGAIAFTSTGGLQNIALPVTMPASEGSYHVYIDVRAEGVLIGAYQATEDVTIAEEAAPEEISFSVKLSDIPNYAAGAYQWFISYGGQNWGMEDPQGGIWTPIEEPITVSGPATGTVIAQLHAGPYEAWTFRAGRNFIEGKEYTFQLAAGMLASGVALTNLVVEPDFLYQGESITISVTVVNSEDSSQEYEVVFKIAGTEVGRETVSLQAQESKVVSIVFTPTQAGSYTAQVEYLYDSFVVKEPYPDVSQPKLISISWLSETERPRPGYPLGIQGAIRLPRPEENQVYLLIANFDSGGLETGVELTYRSNGVWDFVGDALWPYIQGGQKCLVNYEIFYEIACPAGCGVFVSVETSAADAMSKMQSHLNSSCARGNQPHCGHVITLANIATVKRPLYVYLYEPCPGTRVNLKLTLYLYQLFPGSSDYELLNEWAIPSGLYKIA